MTPINGFDAFLGPAVNRYFGEGYRKTEYTISQLRQRTDPPGTLTAVAGVHYSPDWSLKAGLRRTPHLSTLDALVLGAWLGQAHLAGIGLSPGSVSRAWMPEVAVRAGRRPVQDLGAIALSASVVHEAASEIPGWMRTQLTTKVGPLVCLVTLEHDPPGRAGAARSSLFLEARPETYTTAFRSTRHVFEPGTIGELGMQGRVRFEPALSPPPSGLAAAYWPSPVFIDHLVIAGQMAEVVLACVRSAHGRDSSSNLWMRQISMRAPGPRLPLEGDAHGAIRNHREGQHKGVRWRSFETQAMVAGVEILCRVADVRPLDQQERVERSTAG